MYICIYIYICTYVRTYVYTYTCVDMSTTSPSQVKVGGFDAFVTSNVPPGAGVSHPQRRQYAKITFRETYLFSINNTCKQCKRGWTRRRQQCCCRFRTDARSITQITVSPIPGHSKASDFACFKPGWHAHSVARKSFYKACCPPKAAVMRRRSPATVSSLKFKHTISKGGSQILESWLVSASNCPSKFQSSRVRIRFS